MQILLLEILHTKWIRQAHYWARLELVLKSSLSWKFEHTIISGPDGSLVYRCEFSCPIFFKSRVERDEHALDIHKNGLICSVCEKLHKTRKNRDACVRAHHHPPVKKTPFVCTKCGMLSLTIRYFDEVSWIFLQLVPGGSFTSRTYLTEHEKSDCGRIDTYKCDECEWTTTVKYKLKRHAMTHTGEKKFACDLCDQRFLDKGAMKMHARYKHSSERPFKCSYCEKRFVDSAGMRTHTAIHTGIKRYVCYGCGDRFPSNSALHKHRNVRKDTCALVPIQPPLPEAES